MKIPYEIGNLSWL